MTCDQSSAAAAVGAGYLGPTLTGHETGYADVAGAEFTLRKPNCPDGYYVLGHVGTTPSVPLPASNYFCVNRAILRRAGDPAHNSDAQLAAPGGWQRVYKSSIPWFQGRDTNPTILPEYDKSVTILYPDCSAQALLSVPLHIPLFLSLLHSLSLSLSSLSLSLSHIHPLFVCSLSLSLSVPRFLIVPLPL